MAQSHYELELPDHQHDTAGLSDTGELISLALWLRSEAAAASRAAVGDADPFGQRLSLDAAARLERASEIVKAYADLARRQRAAEESLVAPKRA